MISVKHYLYHSTLLGTQHSFSEEEKLAFVDWINFQLENDPEMKERLPISEDGHALFAAMEDGIVMW